MPALRPAEVITSPFVDVEGVGVDLDRREAPASSPAQAQWVAARRPSSRPAWASAKAPLQTESTRAPRREAARSAASASSRRRLEDSGVGRGRRPYRRGAGPRGRPRA